MIHDSQHWAHCKILLLTFLITLACGISGVNSEGVLIYLRKLN